MQPFAAQYFSSNPRVLTNLRMIVSIPKKTAILQRGGRGYPYPTSCSLFSRRISDVGWIPRMWAV
jgi:hypothetical protein